MEMVTPIMLHNNQATTTLYTLSLHDALPIYASAATAGVGSPKRPSRCVARAHRCIPSHMSPIQHSTRRSEEHTSELQSRGHLVCRLLLEKKKKEKEKEKRRREKEDTAKYDIS